MAKCTVYFDESISQQEVHQIKSAIQLIRGVRFVETESSSAGGSQSNQYAPPIYEQPQQQAPQYSQPAYAPPQPQQHNYAPQPPPKYQQQQMPPQYQQPQPGVRDTETMGLNTQRHAINHAIKWAVRKNILTVEELTNLSPEETVSKAMSFIDMMPEDEKKQLGSDLSSFYS